MTIVFNQNQSKAFCTIISKNYLAYARTLGKSLKQHNPGLLFFVLVVDHIEDKFDPSKEDFIIINLDSLKIDNFNDFSFKYSVIELSTAVKPYLLEYIIEHYKIEKLIYLDPDIYVYQALDYLFILLDTYSCILIPHITQSYPEDNKVMRDKHILLSGLYNLGFIAIANSDNANSLLKWWQEKVYDQCVIDRENGIFVDQKWMDFAPIMFDRIYILKQSGYNVAYWNLHENHLKLKEQVWYCNDQQLYFYHFSGIFLEQLDTISKYQNRYSLFDKSELRSLFESYSQCLIESQYYECIKWAYTYDYYNNGQKINIEERKNYYKLGKLRHKLFRNPFNFNIVNILQIKFLAFFIHITRNFIFKKISLQQQAKLKIILEKLTLINVNFSS